MSWLGLLGHDAVVHRFQRVLECDRLASTYLFVGPPGIGKFSFALRLAQTLFCSQVAQARMSPCGQCPACRQTLSESHPDLLVIRKPLDRSQIPIEAFIGPPERRLQEGLCAWIALKPLPGSRRIAIIDDADLLGLEAANSILKTLEEPPPGSLLILVGTNPDAQLPTIRSRCQTVYFSPLQESDLRTLLVQRGLLADPSLLEFVVPISAGSLVRACQLADPAIREFRGQWLKQLAAGDGNPVQLSSDAMKFVEAAGKEAAAKRDRLRLLIEMIIELYRQAVRVRLGLLPPDGSGVDDDSGILAERWTCDLESLAVSIDRCVSALWHVDAHAQLQNVLDALLGDLDRLRLWGRRGQLEVTIR